MGLEHLWWGWQGEFTHWYHIKGKSFDGMFNGMVTKYNKNEPYLSKIQQKIIMNISTINDKHSVRQIILT